MSPSPLQERAATAPFVADFVWPDGLERIAAEVEALADRAESPNPFFRPAFLGPAIDFRRPRGVAVAVVRREGRAVLALPIAQTGAPGVLRVFTHSYGPLGTPLAERACATEAGQALRDALRQKGGLLLALPDLPLDDPTVRAFTEGLTSAGAAPVEAIVERRPILRGGGVAGRPGLDELVSKKRRKEFARQLRRLADGGPVARRTAQAPDAVAAAAESFLDLERSGWKGRGGTALAVGQDSARFAGRVVSALAGVGRLRVRTLDVDGRAVAAMIELADGRLRIPWKIAFDESRAALSPGALLMLEATADWIADRGVDRVDPVCRPDNPLLAHQWRDDEPYGMRLVPLRAAAQPLARLAGAVLATDRRLRSLSLARRLVQAARGVRRPPKDGPSKDAS